MTRADFLLYFMRRMRRTIYALECVAHLIASVEDSQVLATFLEWDDLMS